MKKLYENYTKESFSLLVNDATISFLSSIFIIIIAFYEVNVTK